VKDAEVTQYLESRFHDNSLEALEKYVRNRMKDSNEVFLAIVENKHDMHIGNIKLGPINWIHRIADIGILIGEKDHWGKGIGTEAIRLTVDYAFGTLNLHKLTAGCYSPNNASLKAFQKNGFEIEGIRKKHRYYDGKYVDAILLGLLNEGDVDSKK
jgi:RimJ/RimL family protein N-acetyltransferase